MIAAAVQPQIQRRVSVELVLKTTEMLLFSGSRGQPRKARCTVQRQCLVWAVR